jgi:hypothetical protein
VNGIAPESITTESDLNALFPADTRKEKMKEMETEMGIPLEILRPNNAVYGTFIFLFFTGIPLFSLGWFPAVLTMVVSGLVIYFLAKSANNFKMKTVGLLADHLAWKNYLKDKQHSLQFSKEDVVNQLQQLVK